MRVISIKVSIEKSLETYLMSLVYHPIYDRPVNSYFYLLVQINGP